MPEPTESKNPAAAKPPSHAGRYVAVGIGIFVLSRIFTGGTAAMREYEKAQGTQSTHQLNTQSLQEAMERDIREGRASDTVLILSGIDPKEYRQRFPLPAKPQESADDPSESSGDATASPERKTIDEVDQAVPDPESGK